MKKLQDTDMCPVCLSTNVGVINSRKHGNAYRVRRKQCNECKHRWSTVEISRKDFDQLLLEAGKSSFDNELVDLKKSLDELTDQLLLARIRLVNKITLLRSKQEEE